MSPDRAHILAVEDDFDFAQVLTEILAADFDVTVAPTLAMAEALLAIVQPDLILLDLRLPDSPRRQETVDRMAEATAVPIVAYSACSAAEAEVLRSRTVAAGAVGFLRKGETDGLSWGATAGRGLLVGALKAWIDGTRAEPQAEPVRVLIVEDEDWMVDILKGAVGAAVPGAVCDVAVGRDDVERKLRARKYRLVILDLNIVGSSGLSTLNAVADLVGLEHVVVVTGATDLEADISRRGVPFLAKPFRRADLIAAIERAVASRPPAVSLLGLLRSAYVDLDRAVNQPRGTR